MNKMDKHIDDLLKAIAYTLQPDLMELLEYLQKDLNEQADTEGRLHPLMEITSRIKTLESVHNKLKKHNVQLPDNDWQKSLTLLYQNVSDILGFRLLCPNKESVFSVVYQLKALLAEEGLPIIKEKNNISPPNIDTPNGEKDFEAFSLHSPEASRHYRSYHITISCDGIPVEIQLRTYGMHFYAQVEHGMGYKSDIELPEKSQRELAQISDEIDKLDDELYRIYGEILNYKHHIRPIDQLTTKHNIILRSSANHWIFVVIDKDGTELYSETGQVERFIQSELAAANFALAWCLDNNISNCRIFYHDNKLGMLAKGKQNTQSELIQPFVDAIREKLTRANNNRLSISWRWIDENVDQTIKNWSKIAKNRL